MTVDRRAEVAQLWQGHREASFPARLRGADVVGVDMVLVDAFTAGCISTWLDQDGRIDDRRWDVLADCEQQLLRVIAKLDDDATAYYQRLLDMTALVLEAPTGPPL